jgi:hypothetical protein
MYDCPDQACYQYRIITADVAGVLLHDQRIDQHLEGGLGFDNEVIILRGRLDESAEHHPILGRTRDRETVRMPWPLLQSRCGHARSVPRHGRRLARACGPFTPRRRQQGLLVGKMPV